MNEVWYLASPYSHKDHKVVSDRYDKTQIATVWLLRQQIWTYSPIVHCHELAQRFKLPTDAKYWEDYNHTMIEKFTGVMVLLLEGWQDSKGVANEVIHALSLVKPVREIAIQNNEFVFTNGQYLFRAKS